MSADQARRALRRERLRRLPELAATDTAAVRKPDPGSPTTGQWLRRAVVRVSDGSVQLVLHGAARGILRLRDRGRKVAAWLGEAEGFDKLLRIGLLLALGFVVRKVATAIALWAYRRIESGAWGWPAFIAAGVWIVCAYRAGRPGWKPKPPKETPAPDAEQQGAEEPAGVAAEPEVDTATEAPPAVPLEKPPLPILPDLRISLARVGTPHAHLAVLAADIGTTPERVREALDKWQIPVEAVRMQGRGTSTGVKGGPAVHPALALRPEDAAVVAAGQPANNNSNNTFETVPDQENPVRTHVIWKTTETTD